MVFTYYCRVAIMARSCSSLVGGGCWQEAGARDVSPCCCCCCWYWQDMICGGGNGDGDDDSYSELVNEISSSARAAI